MIKALFSYLKQHLVRHRYKIVPYAHGYRVLKRIWFRWKDAFSFLQLSAIPIDTPLSLRMVQFPRIYDDYSNAMMMIFNMHKQEGDIYVHVSVILEGE